MPFQWDPLVIPYSESLLPQDNLVANLHQEWQPNQIGKERLWPSIPCHGFCHKCEGASSLFIFSTSSSGPICILQHYFYLAYTSSVRGSLTSTPFLLDSVKYVVSHKRCCENTLSGNVPCWIKATSRVLRLVARGVELRVRQLHRSGVATVLLSWSGLAEVVSFWA